MPTTFIQNQKFANQPEEVISEFNFIGGLVKDVHETKLEPSQSPEMFNTIFNDTASIKTRNGFVRYNGDPVGASSSISNTGTATDSLSIAIPQDYVAQSFETVGAINVLQVDLSLSMANSSQEQLVRAELWTAGPGSLIAKSQILNISGDSEATYSFRFRAPVALSATTEYVIVIKPFVRGTAQTINEVLVYHRADTYADGQVYISEDAGQSWTGDDTIDLKFSVYEGGDTGCSGLIRYYGPAGLQQLVAKFGTNLYVGNDQTGALTAASLPSTLSTDFVDYTISNDATLLVVDRLNKILKYRGSTNANYSTGTISVTNGSATVTGSGTSWATTTNAVAGEYIQLPDGKWYLITAIASNTSLTVETTYTGSTASGQSYAISPWGEVNGSINSSSANLTAPTPKYIENHVNRIWALDGNRLYFSVLDTSVAGEYINDWDTPANSGQIIIPSGKGDTGTGLYSLNNVLYIFQRRAIWALYGNSPANFELRNITNEVGMLDKRTLIEWGNVLMFLSDRGIIMFDGSNTRDISDGVVSSLIRSWASKTTPVACLWENKYILSYTASGEAYNNYALYYDFTDGIFGALKDVPAGVWSSWEGGTDTGQIYFGSSNQGTIYRWDIGGNDDGYEIHTLHDTPSLGFKAGVNDKSIKKFYIQQLAKGDYYMQVSQTTDISADTIPSQVYLAGGEQSLYDVAIYDEDAYSAEGTILTDRIAEFQGIAKYYKFRFEHIGYDEGIEIIAMVVTARKRRLQ